MDLELITLIHMLITLLGKKLDTGAVSKNVSGINRFRISISFAFVSEVVFVKMPSRQRKARAKRRAEYLQKREEERSSEESKSRTISSEPRAKTNR